MFAGVRAAENQTHVRAGQLHAQVVVRAAGRGPVQRDAAGRGGGGGGRARAGRGRQPAGHGDGHGHAVQGLRAGLQEPGLHGHAVPGHPELGGLGHVRGHQAVHHQRGEHEPAGRRERAGQDHHQQAAQALGAGARPGGGRGPVVRAPHGFRPVPHGRPEHQGGPAQLHRQRSDGERPVGLPARGRHRAPGARPRAPDRRARHHGRGERLARLAVPPAAVVRVPAVGRVQLHGRAHPGARDRQPVAGHTRETGAGRPADRDGTRRGHHGQARADRLRARGGRQLTAHAAAAHDRRRARGPDQDEGAGAAGRGAAGEDGRGTVARARPARGTGRRQ